MGCAPVIEVELKDMAARRVQAGGLGAEGGQLHAPQGDQGGRRDHIHHRRQYGLDFFACDLVSLAVQSFSALPVMPVHFDVVVVVTEAGVGWAVAAKLATGAANSMAVAEARIRERVFINGAPLGGCGPYPNRDASYARLGPSPRCPSHERFFIFVVGDCGEQDCFKSCAAQLLLATGRRKPGISMEIARAGQYPDVARMLRAGKFVGTRQLRGVLMGV